MYITSGEFTFWSKCLASLYDNTKRYSIIFGITLSICIWCFIYSNIHLNQFPTLIICISTSIGLIFLTLLLGNGIYTLPKKFYELSQIHKKKDDMYLYLSSIIYHANIEFIICQKLNNCVQYLLYKNISRDSIDIYDEKNKLDIQYKLQIILSNIPSLDTFSFLYISTTINTINNDNDIPFINYLYDIDISSIKHNDLVKLHELVLYHTRYLQDIRENFFNVFTTIYRKEIFEYFIKYPTTLVRDIFFQYSTTSTNVNTTVDSTITNTTTSC